MKNSQMSRVILFSGRLSMACLLPLGVIACGDAADRNSVPEQVAGASADAATYDVSLQEAPCEAVPAAMLGRLFDVPAGEIEQTPVHVMGTASCSSEWEGGGKELAVEMRLRVFETTEQATRRFKNSTRSMTREDVVKAAQALKGNTSSGGDDTQSAVANSLLSAIASRAITFETVAGIGDEAAFGISDGTLVVRSGNLIVHVSAYYGAGMPMPDELTPAAVMKAHAEWSKKVMPTRRQQSIDVARAIVTRF